MGITIQEISFEEAKKKLSKTPEPIYLITDEFPKGIRVVSLREENGRWDFVLARPHDKHTWNLHWSIESEEKLYKIGGCLVSGHLRQ